MQDQNVREREVALNYVLWRDRWYQICVLEGKAENYMCTGGKNGWTDVCWREKRMDRCVLEGKSGQTAGRPPPAHIKNRKLDKPSRQHTFF